MSGPTGVRKYNVELYYGYGGVTRATSMVKLYKFIENNKALYWEAWEADGEVVLHSGDLGERGESQSVPLKRDESSEKLIEREANKYRADGYRELQEGEEYTVIVQYRVEGWGTPEDLAKRHTIEDLFNEVLGWTGNGNCDGGDIGSGTLNIFCPVVNPYLASQAMVEELRKNGFLEGAVIAIDRDDSFEVLYPENHDEEFAYWYE